jgi:hypothetical protein
MTKQEKFRADINVGYTFKGDTVTLGAAMLDGKPVEETVVKLPLKTLNRHGLIAGATGTGKTKSLQVMAECLSDASVPVMLMDIKGDLSGLAASGETKDFILQRTDAAGISYEPTAFPVKLLSLSDEKGTRLRATVSEFGLILLSKVLGLNDTQEGILSVIFKYCDDNGLPLVDLKDFVKTIQYLGDEGKDAFQEAYGSMSSSSMGTILWKTIELQHQGGDIFFGEKSFDVDDLMRIDSSGKGYISIVWVTDLQDRPKLFSTFMLSLLAELYQSLPEAGDEDRPKLVMIIDEAPLVFKEASKALLDQIEAVVKLIRSKGVGIYFCTQNPQDIPSAVLSQLGLKIQHALRAFTANDRKAIKLAADNYPLSDYYETSEVLTQLGIGEALVSALNEKGIPTPLVQTYMCPPRSRMDILSEKEIDDVVEKSKIAAEYNEEIDRGSAHEILAKKMEVITQEEAEAEEAKGSITTAKRGRPKQEKSMLQEILGSSAARQVGRTAATLITRSLLGALGISTTKRRTSKKSSWF